MATFAFLLYLRMPFFALALASLQASGSLLLGEGDLAQVCRMAMSAQKVAMQDSDAKLAQLTDDITEQLRKVVARTGEDLKYNHLDTEATSIVRGMEQAQYLALRKYNAPKAESVSEQVTVENREPNLWPGGWTTDQEMASRHAYDVLMADITTSNAEALKARDEAKEMIGSMDVSAQKVAVQDSDAKLAQPTDDITEQLPKVARLRKVVARTDEDLKYDHLDTKATSKVRGMEQAQYLALRKYNASKAESVNEQDTVENREPNLWPGGWTTDQEMASRHAYEILMAYITASNAEALKARDEATEMIGRSLQKIVSTNAALHSVHLASTTRTQRLQELMSTCERMGVVVEQHEHETQSASIPSVSAPQVQSV